MEGSVPLAPDSVPPQKAGAKARAPAPLAVELGEAVAQAGAEGREREAERPEPCLGERRRRPSEPLTLSQPCHDDHTHDLRCLSIMQTNLVVAIH